LDRLPAPARRLGVHSLWGHRYEAYIGRLRLPDGVEVTVACLRGDAPGETLHVALAGPGAGRVEALMGTDPLRALEQAAQDTGLVAAEGPLHRLAGLGFFASHRGGRLVLQYRPGRVIVVAEPRLLEKLLDALEPPAQGCGEALEAARRAAREAQRLLGDCEYRGLVYLVA
jgi:hypothetical protein